MNFSMKSPSPVFSFTDYLEKAHAYKKAKYASLMAEGVERQWQTWCMPFKVGCQEFMGNSLINFLKKNLVFLVDIGHWHLGLLEMLLREPLHGFWTKHRKWLQVIEYYHQAPIRDGPRVNTLIHCPTSQMWY